MSKQVLFLVWFFLVFLLVGCADKITKITKKCFSRCIKNQKNYKAKVSYMVTFSEGVGCSDVTGFPREDRSDNRRSTAVKVSDHLVEGHIQPQTRTRQQV